MDKSIINNLIICKQNFDKKFQEFAYKHDLDAVFQFEYDNYLHPIAEQIIPLIYRDIKDKPNLSLSIRDYLPYISSKYHDFVQKEMLNQEKASHNMNKNIGRKLLNSFTNHLISYSKKDDQQKNESLNEFFKQHYHIFKIIIKNDPCYGLDLCAKMRNPVFQNILINNFHHPLSEYIDCSDDEYFQKNILPLFIYPTDIGVKDYYNKWVSKEALHVKLCKPILGKHYENAKVYLKEQYKMEKKSQR